MLKIVSKEQRKVNIYVIIIVFLFLLVLVEAIYFNSRTGLNEVVAKVNDETITKEELYNLW